MSKRRAAHVDGDEVGACRPAAAADGRAHHAAGRAGAEQRHRPLGDVVGRHDAAGRLHDQHSARVAGGAQLLDEWRTCSGDPRRDVRVDERGRHPLELGPARHHLVRQRDVLDVGELLADQSRRPPLVGRVHEAEQEHHRDRRARRAGVSRRTPARTASSSSGESTSPSKAQPLGDRDARPAAGDRRRRRVRRVPDLLLVHPAHLDLVAMALGDEQAGRRAVHLDHRVVGGGRAVDDDVELRGRSRSSVSAEAVGELADAVHHADRLVVERRRRLVEHDLAVGRHADEVGERARRRRHRCGSPSRVTSRGAGDDDRAASLGGRARRPRA